MCDEFSLREQALRLVDMVEYRNGQGTIADFGRHHAQLLNQQARVTAMQEQLKDLEQELAMSTSNERSALASLAKDECSRLCTNVTTQLPRELRDMVYQYLLPESEKRINREYFRSTMDPVTRMYTYNPARWKAVHHPEHFWDIQYVGKPFFQELSETYYRTSTFVFGDDDDLIQRFLEADQLSLGYQPRDLVAKVKIHLCAITYDRSSCIGYMFGSATKPERLQAALKGLERLKYGASVTVHFATQGKDDDAKAAQRATALSVLVPQLQKLRGNGYNIRLIVDKGTHISLE